MFNKKEIGIILITTIVLGFGITLFQNINVFLIGLLGIFIVILVNSIAKKITAFYLDSNIEIEIWEFKRFGAKPNQTLKKGFPAGLVIPLITRLIFYSLNGFLWMASLVFETKATKYRARKKHNLYSFSEMTEDHIGYIAAIGIGANLLFAILFYLVGLTSFAKYNVWFALFNMIPLSNLDGNKIFFGNYTLWAFLATVTLIALGYSLWLI